MRRNYIGNRMNDDTDANIAFVTTTFPKKVDKDAKLYQTHVSAQSIIKKNSIR